MSSIYDETIKSNNNTLVYKKKKKHYCSNCGKFGHPFKKCKEPTTSIGIICIKLDSEYKEKLLKELNLISDKDNLLNILNVNNKSYNNFKFINTFKNKIKFLFIRRRHTLSYIEFIRGRYEVDNIENIVSLFELMTEDEIKNIESNTFTELWCKLWKKTSCSKYYEKEFETSKKKFNKLKSGIDIDKKINLDFIVKNTNIKFKTPEWGFPKGRRNYHEKNIDCATREFYEETSYKAEDYKLFDNVTPINEVFNGTNGILYKHIYYLGVDSSNKPAEINQENIHQVDEIGDIGWFTYDEAISKIRPYYPEKKKLLNEIYLFIVNMIINSENQDLNN